MQYAVEQASRINKTNHNTKVQVWVGAGEYTDYKGYIMRDSVTVLGGFPTSLYRAPGETERKALLSAVVAIPKSAENVDVAPRNYETILQVSNVNPRLDENTFNPAAKFFNDDDYMVNEVTDTRTYEYKNVNIVRHFANTTTLEVGDDVTSTYMKYANMTGSKAKESVSNSDATDEGVSDGKHYWRFGTATPGGLDCWHMSYPEKTNYVANIENSNNNKNDKTRKLYDPKTHNQLTGDDASYTGNWIFIGNGSLTDLIL